MFIPANSNVKRRRPGASAGARRFAVVASQAAIFCASTIAAFLLRFDFTIPPSFRHQLGTVLLIWLLVKSGVFRVLNLDRGWWRFLGFHDVGRLAAGNLLGSLVGGALIFAAVDSSFPRSIYLLDFIVCCLLTVGARVALRVVVDTVDPRADGLRTTRI